MNAALVIAGIFVGLFAWLLSGLLCALLERVIAKGEPPVPLGAWAAFWPFLLPLMLLYFAVERIGRAIGCPEWSDVDAAIERLARKIRP